MRVIVKCRHPGLENEIITCEMLSNLENRDWNEIFKGGQNELWQWGHWVILCCWHRNRCRLMRIIGFHMPFLSFFCMRFSTFIPLITDDINQLSFLTWSTSRYRVLRDLPTFGHIPNKSRSLGDIGKAACSVTPSPTCPLKCFVAISLKNSRAKLTCIALSFPVTTPPKVGSCVVFYTGVLLLTLLVFYNLKSKSPCCPVSSPFKCPWHFFWRWTVVLPVCNMRSKDLGGLQKWDRSSCVSLWNVAIQGWKTRSSHVKCCQTLRIEIETRSSRADRTNFGSEDIEWFLFCWHRNRCRLMRIIGFHMPFFVCGFQHSSPWITDDINQLSFLTWSTSRYRVRDLPTFGHIPNKSRSLGDIGKAACSVTPLPTCPLKCFVAISLKNSRAKLTCIALSFPVTIPPKVGSCVVFYTGVLLLTLLVFYNLKSKSPCCPVSSPFKCPWHFFWRWTVVLPACNMRSKDLGGLQKWDRSSCVSLWNVAIQGWKTRSSHVKCCQTLRTEIETRS